MSFLVIKFCYFINRQNFMKCICVQKFILMEKAVISCLFTLSLNCLSESVNKYILDDISTLLSYFVAEAMMKMNMTKEEKKMMAMENWNMSQLFNRTMNGKLSDLYVTNSMLC